MIRASCLKGDPFLSASLRRGWFIGVAANLFVTAAFAEPKRVVPQPYAPIQLRPLTDTQTVGRSQGDDLIVVDHGTSNAIILVSKEAGTQEKRAAEDLEKYIGLMSGARPEIASDDRAIADATDPTRSKRTILVLGSLAIKLLPSLQQRLSNAAKKNPVVRADAIAILREGSRVYIAGNNDEAHYFAVAKLLREWGCRWFMPGDFGETIPDQPTLKIGQIDIAFGSAFEVRGYWVSWNGEQSDRKIFALRNMMNDVRVSGGHSLGRYTRSLIPDGKSIFDVPIADDKTADAIANNPEVERLYGAGKDLSLGMEDGIYAIRELKDIELQADIFDKYFLAQSLSDNFMVLYNRVSERLASKYPGSKSRIGFLAYSNLTIPPQREIFAAEPLVMSLAPIDIDPNHSMQDARSPSKQEYRSMMLRWAKVMKGRMFIREYDQGMLLWRDLPDPIAPWFEEDVKQYLSAGILGINTESRHAIATVFVNLYLRGQLLWDVKPGARALLSDFYARFYGPLAEPMAAYWEAINQAWANTIVTEHEYLAIPAIYTPALVAELRAHLEAAEARVKTIDSSGNLPRDWSKYPERMKFTRLSFDLIDQYAAGVRAAATDADFATAAQRLDEAVGTRLALGGMNRNFTTRVIPTMKRPETVADGPRQMMGEAEQYRRLGALVDGTRGTLISKLPTEWQFHRDPRDTGLARGYAYETPDMTYWNHSDRTSAPFDRKDYPTDEWEMLRTDVYAQAQGILHPDGQSFTGYLWYRTEVQLDGDQATPGRHIHLMFPGILNPAWLYINGYLVAYQRMPLMLWRGDYKLEWDVDLTDKLVPGPNTITVRLFNPHHFGGLIRRPFLYEPSVEREN